MHYPSSPEIELFPTPPTEEVSKRQRRHHPLVAVAAGALGVALAVVNAACTKQPGVSDEWTDAQASPQPAVIAEPARPVKAGVSPDEHNTVLGLAVRKVVFAAPAAWQRWIAWGPEERSTVNSHGTVKHLTTALVAAMVNEGGKPSSKDKAAAACFFALVEDDTESGGTGNGTNDGVNDGLADYKAGRYADATEHCNRASNGLAGAMRLIDPHDHNARLLGPDNEIMLCGVGCDHGAQAYVVAQGMTGEGDSKIRALYDLNPSDLS